MASQLCQHFLRHPTTLIRHSGAVLSITSSKSIGCTKSYSQLLKPFTTFKEVRCFQFRKPSLLQSIHNRFLYVEQLDNAVFLCPLTSFFILFTSRRLYSSETGSDVDIRSKPTKKRQVAEALSLHKSKIDLDTIPHTTKCLVFDTNSLVVNNVATVEDARQLAAKLCVRLVYSGTNQDGVLCFNLKPHFEKPSKANKKSEPKLFKLTTATTENDLNVKLKNIQTLVTKGKEVSVVIRFTKKSTKELSSVAAHIQDKVSTELKDICTLRSNHVNLKEVKFTLIPIDHDAETKV